MVGYLEHVGVDAVLPPDAPPVHEQIQPSQPVVIQDPVIQPQQPQKALVRIQKIRSWYNPVSPIDAKNGIVF